MAELRKDEDVAVEVDQIGLGVAIELDRVTDCGRLAKSNPAYPKGGLVAAMADELGITVEALRALA